MKWYVWFAACLMAALLVVAGAKTALATCPTGVCVCISTSTCQVLDTDELLVTPSPLDMHITVTSSSGALPNVNATCDGIITRDKGNAVGWNAGNTCDLCNIQIGGVDYQTNDWTETISASGKDENLVNVSLKCHFPGTAE